MGKKKENKISIYGNIILSTDNDLVTGNVFNTLTETTIDIEITNFNEGTYCVVIPSSLVKTESEVTIVLEVYDNDNVMYKIGNTITINNDRLDLVNSYMVNFIVNEDNIIK